MVTSIASIVADHHDPGPFTAARSTAVTVIDPFGRTVDRLLVAGEGAWRGARDAERLNDENDELRRRLARAEAEADTGGRASDDRAELARLRAATDVDHVDDLTTITARVTVLRVTSSGEVIEIDRGSDAGVAIGMPVATADGLVGLVTVVTDDRSVVRPITAAGTTVGVRAGADYGVGRGAGPDRPLILAMDPRVDAEPDVGDRLTTSGVNRSLYPDHLPVGEVVVDESGQPAIAPFVDFARLGYVSVLVWRPE